MDGLEDEMELSGDDAQSSSPMSQDEPPPRTLEDEDEDEDIVRPPRERARLEDDDEDDNDNDNDIDNESDDDNEKDDGDKQDGDDEINKQPQDREDDERSKSSSPPAPPPPVRHECEMPTANPNLGSKMHYVKLPNFLSIDTREYDPLHYEDEIDEDEQLDSEGRARMKLKVENTIRWRKVRDSEGNEVNQSNARVVEWSDGTMSLYLGSEIFDLNEKSLGECSHLFVRLGMRQGLLGQGIFNSKLSIRPNSTESFTHRKLTLSLADKSQKTQKIRMLNNPGQDPEARLTELSKKEDDRLKATLRRETKQRRIQERSQVRGPNASYLEPDYDEEDEDGAISLSAIKRGAMSRTYADDSDEDSESNEQEYSDDSDPEFGKIQRRSERKKKQVVEDSDDE